MTHLENGWHKLLGRDVYVEDGLVKRSTKVSPSGVGEVPAYLYRRNHKEGGLDSTWVTVSSYYYGIKKGTLTWF